MNSQFTLSTYLLPPLPCFLPSCPSFLLSFLLPFDRQKGQKGNSSLEWNNNLKNVEGMMKREK
jgi:hypothetical protein